MSIWTTKTDIESLNKFSANTMIEYVGIIVTEIGDDYLKGTMPVDHRTIQSYGILHGGASTVLAETLGSFASILCVDRTKYKSVGLDINTNHLRIAKSGIVTGIAEPIKLGRRNQVWQIKIYNEENKMVSISRLTTAVISNESL